MGNMLRLLLVVLAGTLLASCSGGFGHMNKVMSSWQGASLNEVISQWGYPNAQQEIAGRQIYIWDTNKTVTLPSTTSGTVNVIGNTAYLNTTTYGGGTLHGSCRRILEVDSNDIVVMWQWKGNNCPFGNLGYSNWPRKGALDTQLSKPISQR